MKLSVHSTQDRVAVTAKGLDALSPDRILSLHAHLIAEVSAGMMQLLRSLGLPPKRQRALLEESEKGALPPLPPHEVLAIVQVTEHMDLLASSGGDGPQQTPEQSVAINARIILAITDHAVASLLPRGWSLDKIEERLIAEAHAATAAALADPKATFQCVTRERRSGLCHDTP